MKIPQDRFFVLVLYDMLLENLDLIARERINCSIYISAHQVIDNCSSGDIEKIRSFFEKSGLRKITHGPFVDLNPGSLDKKIRKVCLERFIETLEISKALGSEYVTFHSGYRPKPYKKYRKEWLGYSAEIWKNVMKRAGKDNIKVNVENAFETSPEPLVELVRMVGSPDFKICFDGGHFNAFSDTPPLEAFDMLPPEAIGEIHLSDNDGSDDQHLPLGEGNICLDTLFERIESLSIKPIFTLEPKDIEGAKDGLAYLRKKAIIT